MTQNNVAHRVSSTTRANGLYALELRKRGPRFSISKDKKKERSRCQCRTSKSDDFFCAIWHIFVQPSFGSCGYNISNI